MNAAQLLNTWEAGLLAKPVERALLLLEAGYPDCSTQHLGRLTLGEKEVYLLRLREQLFGPRLECVADCPQCGAMLEFGFSAADIGASSYRPGCNTWLADHGVEVKPLTLDALCRAQGNGKALLAHAIDGKSPEEQLDSPDAFSAEMVDQVTEVLLELDPLMDIRLELDCSECGHRWSAPFDAASYLWGEIERWGRGMLQTIHFLASTYGWSEGEILAMSAWRRHRYLEMIP